MALPYNENGPYSSACHDRASFKNGRGMTAKKTLSARLVGFAPMQTVVDEKGEFLYLQPLFYQRFD